LKFVEIYVCEICPQNNVVWLKKFKIKIDLIFGSLKQVKN